MDADSVVGAMASCILDHFAFCVDHESAANCAAAEIYTKMRRGYYGACSVNADAALERCAELLHCEPSFVAVILAIEELQGEIGRAKKMIANLRSRCE